MIAKAAGTAKDYRTVVAETSTRMTMGGIIQPCWYVRRILEVIVGDFR